MVTIIFQIFHTQPVIGALVRVIKYRLSFLTQILTLENLTFGIFHIMAYGLSVQVYLFICMTIIVGD